MTGHLLGAAGAVEAVITLKAIEDSFIPATINHRETDPELDLNFVPNVGIAKEFDYGLSNAFGFGGHNATLVFKNTRDSTMNYDIRDIQNTIPHRYPMLLIDKIIDLQEGQRAVGIKNITVNEPFFQGHFPDNPVMPGF